MLRDLVRAFSALGDPRVRNVLWLGIGLALLTLITLTIGIQAALDTWAVTGYWWLDRAEEVLGALGALLLAWFFFPSVVVAISSIFLDRVVDRTEERYFPGLPEPRPVPFGEAATAGLRLLAISLLLNLVALPLYFIPGVNLPLWLTLNGYLVGREYIELIASRRLDPEDVRRLRRRQLPRIWLAGVVIAFFLTIPLLNLLAPIIGAAFMAQRFHRMAGSATPPRHDTRRRVR
jgi:CysZ protein